MSSGEVAPVRGSVDSGQAREATLPRPGVLDADLRTPVDFRVLPDREREVERGVVRPQREDRLLLDIARDCLTWSLDRVPNVCESLEGEGPADWEAEKGNRVDAGTSVGTVE